MDVWLMQWLVTAMPMIILALFGQKRAFWMAAALTTAFWAYFVVQVWIDHRDTAITGANIGLGIIMLGSPIIVLVIALAADRLTRSGRNQG